MAESGGAFVPSELCGWERLRKGVVGMTSVVKEKSNAANDGVERDGRREGDGGG